MLDKVAVPSLFAPMSLRHGPAMKNRLMLAPLTNMQSHDDGALSDDEIRWLVMRAEGGFGLVMTAAAHVQRCGQGFPGQLAIWSDNHLPGLTRLAHAINAQGSLSSVQLQHSGFRARTDLSGAPAVAPWADADSGARALTTAEVEGLIEDFVTAGLRAERAGFHGVELHAAHGYMLGEFLDARHNRRTDGYGGTYGERTRMLWTVIDQLRARSGPGFQIGVRLSPERFGIKVDEARRLAEEIMQSDKVDYLDMSLWDAFKPPRDPAWADRPLLDIFAEVDRGGCRLGVAGKIMTGEDARRCMDSGVDYVLLGRAAILHHDFTRRLESDPDFASRLRPVPRHHLEAEGIGPKFLHYLSTTWTDFVEP